MEEKKDKTVARRICGLDLLQWTDEQWRRRKWNRKQPFRLFHPHNKSFATSERLLSTAENSSEDKLRILGEILSLGFYLYRKKNQNRKLSDAPRWINLHRHSIPLNCWMSDEHSKALLGFEAKFPFAMNFSRHVLVLNAKSSQGSLASFPHPRIMVFKVLVYIYIKFLFSWKCGNVFHHQEDSDVAMAIEASPRIA